MIFTHVYDSRHLVYQDGKPLSTGRHVEHDKRSRDFDVLSGPVAKAKAWWLGRNSSVSQPVLWDRYSPILDQGHLGSCTGNAMTGLLGTAPFSTSAAAAAKYNENYAVRLYGMATRLDTIPGEYPPDDTGSSGLAVAKAARQLGEIRSYAHAFTTSALIYALQSGPVIVGIPWYQGFYRPTGLLAEIRISGSIVGGHEFLVRGYDPLTRLFLADNSWGTGWGRNGSFRFSVNTWNLLRTQLADVTVPKR